MGSEEPQKRSGDRAPDELRPVKITRGYLKFAEGAVLMETGDTKVLCTATAEERVPPFLKDSGRGWITAEYSMLPRSGKSRIKRESVSGRVGGRTHEIQRLIGRSLRAVFDLGELDGWTVTVDCDVLQADGGTRTAAITGAYIAVMDTLEVLRAAGAIAAVPSRDSVAAVSVGIVGGRPYLDLDYKEDYGAEVDMNVIMTGSARFVEVQGTAEMAVFTREELDGLLDFASKGIATLTGLQRRSLEGKPGS